MIGAEQEILAHGEIGEEPAALQHVGKAERHDLVRRQAIDAPLSQADLSRAGEIRLGERRIDGLPPHKIVTLGLSHVLERRRLFPYLSVRQNLLLGAYHPGARAHREETLADVETLFPRLRERQRQMAGTLSGGEQQMVAIG